MAPTDDMSINEFANYLKKSFTSIGNLDTYVNAYQQLGAAATNLNQAFTQNRQRIVEMQLSIANSIPSITRLGGSITDVETTISQIAIASNRNIIANSESVEKLFSATKVLGGSVESLVNDFLDVGIALEQIPKQLEESIFYVQSIGGNAKEVMEDVVRNTDQLNRYQFEGGVKGLTKMAAQAAMLRFDMNETLRMADGLFDPDKAVELASSFQRLGVAAGNLVDPFQLMNQSINDPSGLQDSLANVAKQFTYFDEQTKSFKINPAGVMILREMEQSANLTSGSLSKMGLAASEVDARLSEINMAGLKFENEEDKQYLSNIAKMGKGGRYEVELKDGTTKELRNLNQEEFQALIDEQKKGPQTLEEIQRSQLNLSELMANDVAAIRDKIVFGLASTRPAVEGGEIARSVVKAFGGAASGRGVADVETLRKYPEQFIKGAEQLIKSIQEGKATEDSLKEYFQTNKEIVSGIGSDFKRGLMTYTDKVVSGLGDSSVEKKLKEYLVTFQSGVKSDEMKLKGGQSLISGIAPVSSSYSAASASGTKDGKMAVKHNFDELVIKVEPSSAFNNMSTSLTSQILSDAFNSTRFRAYIEKLFDYKDTSASPNTINY